MDPRIAPRIGRLGTETAYAVALQAAQFRDSGNTVYPFHIGDLNFSTPACIIDAMNASVRAGKTSYAPAAGIVSLREALAEHVSGMTGRTYAAENVSVQSGGKPVIGKFLSCVMRDGDEVLYPSPGYPIYESMINYLGGVAVPYSYVEGEHGFEVDVDRVIAAITPRTRVLVVNNLQNPTGHIFRREELEKLAAAAVAHDLYVLSDDAYWDVVYDMPRRHHIGSFDGMQDRMVILFTYSKSWSMTGWRLGAAVGPEWIISCINKLNTNDEACTTHFIQFAGVEALRNPAALEFTRTMVSELRARRDLLVDELNRVPGFRAHAPQSTFYMLVNVTAAASLLGISDIEEFRVYLLQKTGVSVCTRVHFGAPLEGETQMYVRFAYSAVGADIIRAACASLRAHFEPLAAAARAD